jgi:hypothetical protein
MGQLLEAEVLRYEKKR